jgi:hypothetical protein
MSVIRGRCRSFWNHSDLGRSSSAVRARRFCSTEAVATALNERHRQDVKLSLVLVEIGRYSIYERAPQR